MEKIKSALHHNRYIISSFFLSALIVLTVYKLRDIYPFGGQTILKVDLFHQYAPFLEEMRSRLLGGKSLIYSWETGLGKDFIAQSAYYTASPLNLLVLLFPAKMISETVAFLVLIRISLCAPSFAAYARYHFRRNDATLMIFGTLYSFCAFITCYYWNIMWLDTVALFPLVILGLERLVDREDLLTYYLALTLTMIVNFYLAVLVCIFTALYWVVYTFSKDTESLSVPAQIKSGLRFAGLSILCALTSAIILIPVWNALKASAVSGAGFPDFKIYEGSWQLLNAHFLGARDAVLARNSDMPNIFSGVLAIVLLPLYYGDRKTGRTEKILMSLLLLFMLLCSCIRPLDYLIHGMHFPANLPHRFTFIYSFFLLCMAYRGFLSLKETSLKPVFLFAAVCGLMIVVFELAVFPRVKAIDRVLTNEDLTLNLLLLIFYPLLLRLLKTASTRTTAQMLTGVFLLFACGESFFSFYCNLSDTGDRWAYIQYMDSMKELTAALEKQETDPFYRTEFRRFTTINEGSLYHFNGFSQFSSLAPGGISSLMDHLGIAATGNSYRYYDPTSLINAMFDIKYVLNKDGEHPRASNYSYLGQVGNVWAYRNDRTLPLAYMADPAVADWETENSDPFTVQNDFLHKAAGIEDDMFIPIKEDSVSTENIRISEGGQPAHFNYRLEDPGNLDLEPVVSAEFTSPVDQYIFLYVEAPNARRFVYATPSAREDRELSAGRSLIDVGPVSAGDKIHVEFALTKKGEFEKSYRAAGSVSLFAAGYRDDAFQKGYDRLHSSVLEISRFTDTKTEGTVNAEKDGILCTSIPYAKGWKIYVDGKRTKTLSIGGEGLVAAEIPAGRHSVVILYDTGLLLPCALASLAGIILFLLWLMTGRWLRSRR